LPGVTAQERSQPAAANSQVSTPKSIREWKLLRTRARSAAEFRALSAWCDGQLQRCRRKQTQYEKSLQEYYAAGRFYHPVKTAPREDERLKSQIDGCKQRASYWSRLSRQYSDKAKTTESALPNDQARP
jgi:hypothetical protein